MTAYSDAEFPPQHFESPDPAARNLGVRPAPGDGLGTEQRQEAALAAGREIFQFKVGLAWQMI
jgi:hypothetical protein